MPKCANPNCDHELGNHRSQPNPTYCPTCGEMVWAFRPDSQRPDDWYLVGDDPEPPVGTVVLGDQCEGCGLSEYLVTYRSDSRTEYVALCDGQHHDQEWMDGCGAQHPVRRRMRCLVLE